jgi:hypothetical protein
VATLRLKNLRYQHCFCQYDDFSIFSSTSSIYWEATEIRNQLFANYCPESLKLVEESSWWLTAGRCLLTPRKAVNHRQHSFSIVFRACNDISLSDSPFAKRAIGNLWNERYEITFNLLFVSLKKSNNLWEIAFKLLSLMHLCTCNNFPRLQLHPVLQRRCATWTRNMFVSYTLWEEHAVIYSSFNILLGKSYVMLVILLFM